MEEARGTSFVNHVEMSVGAGQSPFEFKDGKSYLRKVSYLCSTNELPPDNFPSGPSRTRLRRPKFKAVDILSFPSTTRSSPGYRTCG